MECHHTWISDSPRACMRALMKLSLVRKFLCSMLSGLYSATPVVSPGSDNCGDNRIYDCVQPWYEGMKCRAAFIKKPFRARRKCETSSVTDRKVSSLSPHRNAQAFLFAGCSWAAKHAFVQSHTVMHKYNGNTETWASTPKSQAFFSWRSHYHVLLLD